MNFRLPVIAALWTLSGVHLAGAPARTPSRTSSRNAAQAVVRGTVTDPSSADISGAKVYFIHGKKKIRIRTSPTGAYSAGLAPGIYSIRVEEPGFCYGLRGEFFAREGSRITFNFMLTIAPSEVVTVESGANGNSTMSSSRTVGGCYKSEELPAPVQDGPKPLVLYDKREVNGDIVRYSGLRDNSAIYMYDQLRVRATTLEYSTKDYSVEGSGGVTLQDGGTVTNATQVRITFRDGKPQIDSTD